MQAVWIRQVADAGSTVNLEDLRAQLAGRLALLLIGASGLAMWAGLPLATFPPLAFVMLAVLFALGLGVRALLKQYPRLAQHLLVWGLTAGLLAAMGLFADPWLPFLGLLLTFVAAVLISGGELFTAAIIAAAAAVWTLSGQRAYPLPNLGVGLGLGVALSWLVVWTLYTALQWAWSMQQRADGLLEEVQDRQAELSRVLKSSELANSLLRRAQHELIAARKQADEARQLKEQFAANISHELRTPLNLILGFSELMYLWPGVYGDMRWPPNLRRAVYQVYQSSRHLLEMIDDILDLSRFEIAGFSLNKEPTPLEPLLRDTVEIVEDLFRSHAITLEASICPDLPVLEIDRTRIRQVLLNLLNNALRFSQEGTVRLEAKRLENEVVISVSDTGPGIPPEKLPHIFEEFYQVDLSLRRQHQGAGLGLAISKRFIRMHGGRIGVESQVGAGSTFFFALPTAGHVSAVPAPRELPEPQWPQGQGSLLLVDPDPVLAALVHRHLPDYTVVPVDDPGQLAGAAAVHHPRAVIYNLPPDRPGDAGALPSLAVPTIFCSLPSQAWLRDRLAVTACLTKPVTAERLLAEIETLGELNQVLIIDDDRGFVQLVELILQTTGKNFNLSHAYDGERGLQLARTLQPDLVLLDLLMPGLDGLQLLEAFRAEPELSRVPVILLTASSYAEETLAQRGCQITVHRPDGLAPGEVLTCLKAVIGVLEPHYDEKSLPEEMVLPVMAP